MAGFRPKTGGAKPAPLKATPPENGDLGQGEVIPTNPALTPPVNPNPVDNGIRPLPLPVDDDFEYNRPIWGVPIEQPSIPEYRPPNSIAPPPLGNPIITPTYVEPINKGGAGAAVMSYGYNPTTNQYSISGGGSMGFPEGFESSMSAEELYKKYPRIRGVFEQPTPRRNKSDNISDPGGK